MPAISTNDFKTGMTLELDNKLYTILDYEHIKMGRGSAQVRIKLRDVRGGHTIEKTFQAGERFPRARLEKFDVTYLYEDNGMLDSAARVYAQLKTRMGDQDWVQGRLNELMGKLGWDRLESGEAK